MSIRGKAREVALAAVLLTVAGAGLYLLARWQRGESDYRAAQEALDRRDFWWAGECLRRWLASHPDDAAARLLAAEAARRRGEPGAAAAQLDLCERLGGPRGSVECERRLLRLQSGDLAGAGALLDDSLRDPSDPRHLLALEAVIHTAILAAAAARVPEGKPPDGSPVGRGSPPDLAKVQRAIDVWLEHRTGKADQAQGYFWRGSLHLLRGDHPEAVTALRAALELDPDHLEARQALAGSLVRGSPEEAAAHLQFLRERGRADAATLFSLATLRRLLGSPDEARRLLDEVLAYNPGHVGALVESGHLDIDEGHPEQAEPRLRRALALASEQPEVHLGLARCLRRLGRAEEARAHEDRFERLRRQK